MINCNSKHCVPCCCANHSTILPYNACYCQPYRVAAAPTFASLDINIDGMIVTRIKVSKALYFTNIKL